MARGRQAIVLVLDDDESVGKFVRSALDEQAYRVVWCAGVAAAVATLDDDIPDLALIDIEIGATESGWDLMRALRDRPETRTIPIVMTLISDPVESGIAASLGRPGGNVTGLSLMHPELSGKRVALLKEVNP
ncbi:MAG TPA: ABC transporter substrate binding protein, partial [Thermoanaerobaculia bacterium]